MDNVIREYLKERPELINKYERNEARFILCLPPDYETVCLNPKLSNELMKCFFIALAEADLSVDEWANFILKSIILSHRMNELVEQNPELKKELWGGHLWNPSYCALSVSDRLGEHYRCGGGIESRGCGL